jgi:hypothetical protein
MKEFNLKDALAGKPVITRDGRPVKIAGCNEDRNSLLGWIYGEVNQWTGGGKSYKIDSTRDLFMAPSERKEWVVRVSDTCVLGPYKRSPEAYDAIIRVGMPGTIHEITIHE